MSKLFPLPHTDPTIKMSSYTLHLILDDVKREKRIKKMPLKLSTIIGTIQCITDTKNIEIINEFFDYIRDNDVSSEHHQNRNLNNTV
jgi:hypothetical protein